MKSDSVVSWLSAHVFTHCLQLNLQVHNIDMVRTCRTSSSYTVAWQLARFQLTRRIAELFVPFWYRLIQVVLEKRPINACSSSRSCSSSTVAVVLHLHAYAYCSSNDSVMITMWPSWFFDLLTVVMRVK